MATALPIALRLAIAPWAVHPSPRIHDEFSYLLAAGTFASGRLTNPTHPMWRSFETFHVLQHPSYASKYPPGQGLLLAAGQVLFGDPIVAVWLSAGVMCGAIGWMLQGWLPPVWALLGVLLTLVGYPSSHYWLNSYWGGTLAAIGGALLLGAVPRIFRRHFVSAWPAAAGLVILGFTRPFEGTLVALPVAAVALWWLVSLPPAGRKIAAVRVLLPVGCVLAAAASFLAYYNWRVTGNALRAPYQEYTRQYDIGLPLFVWQPFQPVPKGYSAERKKFIASYAHKIAAYRTWRGVSARWLEVFDLDPGPAGWACAGLVLALLPSILRLRNTVFPLAVLGIAAAGICLPDAYFPHYAAPLAGLKIWLYVQCLRRSVRLVFGRWSFRVIGGTSIAALFAIAFLSFRFAFTYQTIFGLGVDRPRIIAELDRLPGKHLVLVRYTPVHSPDIEWVYNRAGIDRAKIVWAHELDAGRNAALRSYFHDRRVWLLEPDEIVPHLRPYSAPPEFALLSAGGGSGFRYRGDLPPRVNQIQQK